MRWYGLIGLAALTISVAAQLYPPEVVTTEKGRPKNMMNCRFHARTIFPWIVGVWSKTFYTFIGMGSMITYDTFITTCRQYIATTNQYRATGQFIWNLNRTDEPCGQERDIMQILRHPNCQKDPKMATFFDFAIFKMEKPFDITGRTFPTTTIPNTAMDMLFLIRQVNVNKPSDNCMIPMFRSQNEKPPRFKWDSFVQTIPFKTQCVQLLCEMEPPNAAFTSMCTKRFGERANATMLCLRYRGSDRVPMGIGKYPYWYAGSPFTCSGLAYGVTAQAKIRQRFTHGPTYDFQFVVTFLRVWPWLVRALNDHKPPWLGNIYVENTTDRPVNVPDPFKPVSLSANIIYSDAVAPSPSLNHLVLSMLCNPLWILHIIYAFAM